MKSNLRFVCFSFLTLTSFSLFAQTGAPAAAPAQTSTPPPAPPSIPNEAVEKALTVDLSTGLSRRDPFKLPEYLIIKIRQKLAVSPQLGQNVIDDAVEPIRRWPVASYQLVGIIWDVKKPKAMFLDRMNSMHMLQINDFIGNAKGIVTQIQSGSVTVLEGKIPQIIKLKK